MSIWSIWMMVIAVQPLDEVPNREEPFFPASCSDWPVDGVITLPSDRRGLASALFLLNRGGAMREFSLEKSAAHGLASVILADGRIDPVEQDVLCEMTNPERRGRVDLTIGDNPQGTIWAHRGYTEDILRNALNGIAPPDRFKLR